MSILRLLLISSSSPSIMPSKLLRGNTLTPILMFLRKETDDKRLHHKILTKFAVSVSLKNYLFVLSLSVMAFISDMCQLSQSVTKISSLHNYPPPHGAATFPLRLTAPGAPRTPVAASAQPSAPW